MRTAAQEKQEAVVSQLQEEEEGNLVLEAVEGAPCQEAVSAKVGEVTQAPVEGVYRALEVIS